jgi:hypothetical protein
MDKPNFHDLFDYHDHWGILTWKRASGSVKADGIAGTKDTGGYSRVIINHKSYAVHHIVWFFEHGYWPKEIDHIDRDPSNNRISNLRDVSRSDNMLNKPIQKNNTSGVKGVHFVGNGWVVQLRRKGVKTIQKKFDTKEEAVAFRKEHESSFYGECYESE